MVMLRIKLKLTTHAATRLQMFCQQTHPQPQGWGPKVKPYPSSERSHVAYQIKEN